MKTTKMNMMLLGIFSGFLTVSCGDAQEKEAEDVSAPMQNEMHTMEEAEIDQEASEPLAFEDEIVGAVFEDYIALKEALVASDAEEASLAAEDLAEDLARTEGTEAAIAAVEKIVAADDINVQRTAFEDLTEPIESLVTGAITAGKLYKQYCPMAFEGAGAFWLSNEEVIANPYFGEKMLRCGSTKEVLE